MKKLLLLVMSLVLVMTPVTAFGANDLEWQYAEEDKDSGERPAPEFDIVDVATTTYKHTRFTLWVGFKQEISVVDFLLSPDSFLAVNLDTNLDKETDYVLFFQDNETLSDGAENYEPFEIYDANRNQLLSCNGNKWTDGKLIGFSMDLSCFPYTEVIGVQAAVTDGTSDFIGWDFYPSSDRWVSFRTASYLGDKVNTSVTFSGSKSSITSSIRKKLEVATWKLPASSVTCTGYYSSTSGKSLAQKRAKNTCGEVARLRPTIDVKILTKKASSSKTKQVLVSLVG